MKKGVFTCILFLALAQGFVSAQSLRGKAKMRSADMAESESAVMYGNVEAYDKKGNLVASVLTDELGNYSIAFKDSGSYTIKVMYAGFEPIEETITVAGDELSDFSMERDESRKVRVAPVITYADYAPSAPSGSDGIISSYSSTGSYGGYAKRSSASGSGLASKGRFESDAKTGKGLTAGEINDFAKWDLWNDIVKKELEEHQSVWQLDPRQRYVVQLMNERKSPLVGAEVELVSKSNKVLWKTLTDNTGKAELWGSILGMMEAVSHISIEHYGKKERIRNPSLAKDGVNSLVIDLDCDTKNIVDVAFVVDATGSMADEINFIKSDLNSVIYNSQNIYQDVAIRYASVFYRDTEDDYLTRKKDFTKVLSEALVFIDEQGANGGGDTPEAVDAGLEVALNELSWSEEARSRLLFLVLDAEAHSDPETIKKIHRLATKAASKGVKIIPVAASGINKSGEYLMRSLALCTNGTYVFLTDHSGIGNSHIEPSTDEYDVKLLSERLTEIIKNNMFYPDCDQEIPEYELPFPDSLVQYPYPISEDSLALDSLSTDSLEVRTPQDSLEVDPIEWKFYPNPTSDIVNIEVSENVEVIYLTDLSGKLLQEIPFGTDRRKVISLGSYPSGIYLLRYPVGKHWVTGKIVLTRP